MEVESYEIVFSSKKDVEIIRISEKVKGIVKNSKIKEGLCLLFAPHATGLLIINEDEEGVKEDILNALFKLIPKRANYKHDRIDNNASSHIISALFGTEKIIPIKEGRLQLGTWQEIFFIETDGPRNRRKIIITLIGK